LAAIEAGASGTDPVILAAFHHSKPLQRYNHCAARVTRTFSELYMVPCVAVAKLPGSACAAGIVAL
jgi:hypothetical protein